MSVQISNVIRGAGLCEVIQCNEETLEDKIKVGYQGLNRLMSNIKKLWVECVELPE